MMETIEQLTAARAGWLALEMAKRAPAWTKHDGYFQECLAAQERGLLVFLLARAGERMHGYLKIVWESAYAPFRESAVPEIEDLIVVPEVRRQGVATRLMGRAEQLIGQRSAIAGVGVGLHPGYAAAQRLYAMRGYVPDAMPLTYHNHFVSEGQDVKLDDDLVMHLTKRLKT